MKRLDTNTRTEQQALRAIYDRRAQAVRAFNQHLRAATLARLWAGNPECPAYARTMTKSAAAISFAWARTARINSTMGARLP